MSEEFPGLAEEPPHCNVEPCVLGRGWCGCVGESREDDGIGGSHSSGPGEGLWIRRPLLLLQAGKRGVSAPLTGEVVLASMQEEEVGALQGR